jgi:hypothetical protein
MSRTSFILLTSAVLGYASPDPFTACETDVDCPKALNYTCKPVLTDPDSRKYCVSANTPTRINPCSGAVPPGQCCHDSDCTNATAVGACDAAPGGLYCGGAMPPQINYCIYDQCSGGKKCPSGAVCAVAKAFGLHSAECFTSECSSDNVCRAKYPTNPYIMCMPMFRPTTGCRFLQGFYCVDPAGCTDDVDCETGKVCAYSTSSRKASCVTPGPPPPITKFLGQ